MKILTLNELEDIKDIYTKIGNKVKKYGGENYSGLFDTICDQIRCIDSEESLSSKTNYILSNFERICSCGYGLGNFVIFVEDKDERINLNEELQSDISYLSLRIDTNLHGCEVEYISKDTYRYYFDSKDNYSCYVTIKKDSVHNWYYERVNNVSKSGFFQSIQECIDFAYQDMISSKL